MTVTRPSVDWVQLLPPEAACCTPIRKTLHSAIRTPPRIELIMAPENAEILDER